MSMYFMKFAKTTKKNIYFVVSAARLRKLSKSRERPPFLEDDGTFPQ